MTLITVSPVPGAVTGEQGMWECFRAAVVGRGRENQRHGSIRTQFKVAGLGDEKLGSKAKENLHLLKG